VSPCDVVRSAVCRSAPAGEAPVAHAPRAQVHDRKTACADWHARCLWIGCEDTAPDVKEKRMNRLLAATVVALLPLAGLTVEPAAAPAPATPAGQSGSFDTLDTNKDGRISMPEAAADPKLVEIFSAADKNGDGYLDKTEYANSIKAPPRQ
jgi:hypothetical protein